MHGHEHEGYYRHRLLSGLRETVGPKAMLPHLTCPGLWEIQNRAAALWKRCYNERRLHGSLLVICLARQCGPSYRLPAPMDWSSIFLRISGLCGLEDSHYHSPLPVHVSVSPIQNMSLFAVSGSQCTVCLEGGTC